MTSHLQLAGELSEQQQQHHDGHDSSVLQQPRLASDLDLLLKQNGIVCYDKNILNQLLEFVHRYVVNTMTDAEDYREHTGKETIDVEDINLALVTAAQHTFTRPPPRELLFSLSQTRNRIPLPIVPDRAGVLLPPPQYCLTRNNYTVLMPDAVAAAVVDDVENVNSYSSNHNTVITDDSIVVGASAAMANDAQQGDYAAAELQQEASAAVIIDENVSSTGGDTEMISSTGELITDDSEAAATESATTTTAALATVDNSIENVKHESSHDETIL